MELDVRDLLFGFSTALDAVEGDILGATTHHSKRVAYISSLMARGLGFSDKERLALAVASVMHDNALTQFKQELIMSEEDIMDKNIEKGLGRHCILGEENVSILPIYSHIKNAVLYHHERADGNGPFNKTYSEIPIFAKIIHMADRIDISFDFFNTNEEKYEKMTDHINKHAKDIYGEEMAELFFATVNFDKLKYIEKDRIVEMLFDEVPAEEKNYTNKELIKLAKMFARIIDFKSPFTTRHSVGIAEKARIMGEYYGWDEETCDKLYFAGAVHDVGKLFVDNDLLEKPGKLTAEEYSKIQDHATGSYVVLHPIKGLDEITSWAALHHEKLNGKGYPFGKTAKELGTKERLMACLDIYQALVEPRPYKAGMSHEKTMEILYGMVQDGFIDGDIVSDLDKCFKTWVEPPAE